MFLVFSPKLWLKTLIDLIMQQKLTKICFKIQNYIILFRLFRYCRALKLTAIEVLTNIDQGTPKQCFNLYCEPLVVILNSISVYTF